MVQHMVQHKASCPHSMYSHDCFVTAGSAQLDWKPKDYCELNLCTCGCSERKERVSLSSTSVSVHAYKV